MFGFGIGEIVLLLVIGVVVVGPRNLPTLMRTAGQWITKIRRMTSDLRTESGIDEIIRHEGLEKDIAELRNLTRVGVINTLVKSSAEPAKKAGGPAAAAAVARAKPVAAALAKPAAAAPAKLTREPLRDREYPPLGCDSYGALPDDATPYVQPPRSAPPPVSQPKPAAAKPAVAASKPPPAEPTPPPADVAPRSEAAPKSEAAPAGES